MKKIIIILALLLAVPVAMAAVSAVTGDCSDEGSPAGLDLSIDGTESADIGIYTEKALELTSLLELDEGADIPAGTPVSSTLVHFDAAWVSGDPIYANGTVTFDRPILGVIYTRPLLNASDSILGNAASYETTGNREMDAYDLDNSSLVDNVLTLGLAVTNAIDQARIIQFEPVLVTTSYVGPEEPVVGDIEEWTITVCVDAYDDVDAVVVQGGIGADLWIYSVEGEEVGGPMTKKQVWQHSTEDITLSKRGGKMGATIVTWDVGDMLDGDDPCIDLVVRTGLNPKNKQEYTSEGPHDLDGGFSAIYLYGDPAAELESPETEPLTVEAVED
jgi:hypothetical protein